MERSAIREQFGLTERAPDFASLHPGYEYYLRTSGAIASISLVQMPPE
jgi:hypothetical protein